MLRTSRRKTCTISCRQLLITLQRISITRERPLKLLSFLPPDNLLTQSVSVSRLTQVHCSLHLSNSCVTKTLIQERNETRARMKHEPFSCECVAGIGGVLYPFSVSVSSENEIRGLTGPKSEVFHDFTMERVMCFMTPVNKRVRRPRH